jgi:drug/metabolite transporter (DMT)-like permease
MPFVGELSALLAATSWAATSMIYENVTPKIGSVSTNISRMIIGTVLFVTTITIFDIQIALSSRQVQNLVISSLLGLVLGDTFLFKAFQYIGARFSMLVMTLAPAIAAFLAYLFLEETLSMWGIGGICLTLGGIALVVLERTDPKRTRYHITKRGLVYAFLGAAGQGAGLIFAKMAFAEGSIHGFVAACIRIGIAVLIMLPPAVMTGRYPNPVKLFAQNRKVFLLLMLGAILGVYIGLTLSLVAVSYTEVGIASTLISSSPVVMLPLVRIVHKEKLSLKAIFGACIAFSGVAILFLR